MKKEELIAHLEHLAEYVKYSEDAPALREVIEMLKDNGDCISRQAAIYIASGYCHPANIAKELEKLPPAQPDKRTYKRTEIHTCDLISRQAALNIVVFECGKWTGLAQEISKKLKQLPSVQPKQPEINYKDCADAMLKMWIDEVLTDGEYNRIMDKLNAFWTEKAGRMRYKIEFDLPDSNTLLEHIGSTYASWEVLSCSGYARMTPVDAERKKGKWIAIKKGELGYSVGDFRCTVCERPCPCYHLTPYCPNCGAKMEGKG